ncbi:MAG: hypothetical protein K1X35_12020 [Caulobacteraceae bacterium]|nr:hypothetical protein [Caulobacteraceae bacterium]
MVKTLKARQAGHSRRTLASEIVRTLILLGGAAHRDLVLDSVVIARRRDGKPVEPSLKAELTAAFDAYCEGRMRAGTSALFTLPFGPQSLRWALIDRPSVKVGAAHARAAAAASRLDS